MIDRIPPGDNGVIIADRWTVSLYFQDLKTGDFREVYPQGMLVEDVVKLICDPARQFDPVPPAPQPPPAPSQGEPQ